MRQIVNDTDFNYLWVAMIKCKRRPFPSYKLTSVTPAVSLNPGSTFITTDPELFFWKRKTRRKINDGTNSG